MNQNKTSKLFKDYSTVIFGTGLGRGLSLLTFLILARSLSTEGFGIFSLFFTIMVLVWQLPNVIDSAYVRYVKAELEKSKIDYLKAAFLIKISLFFLLIVLSFPLGFLLSHYAFNKPQLIFYITFAIISGAFLSVFSSLSGLYQAEENFFKFSIVNILFYLGVILVMVPMFIFKLGLTLKVAILINTLMAIIVGSFGFLGILKIIKNLFPIHFFLFSNMFHFTKWLLATSLIYIIFQRLDILVLAKYIDFASLGIYSAAVRIAMLASLLTGSVSVILLPRGSQALKSKENLKSYLKESVTILTILISLILFIILISPMLIKALFGVQYASSVLYVKILLIESIFTVLYTPFMYLFYAQNQGRVVFNLGLTMLIGIICALFVLVPRYGPTGAAISTVFASFCGFIFVVLKTYKNLKKEYGYF